VPSRFRGGKPHRLSPFDEVNTAAVWTEAVFAIDGTYLAQGNEGSAQGTGLMGSDRGRFPVQAASVHDGIVGEYKAKKNS
jgi:hypothetical protein